MKKIFCLCLLSLMASAESPVEQKLPVEGLAGVIEQFQMEQQAIQNQMQNTQPTEYKKVYENPAKEKQLDECANQIVAGKSGEKANLNFCLDYLDSNKQ